MQIHAGARLTPKGRLFVVKRVLEQGCSPKAAADAGGVAERTVYRRLARHRSEGEAGLRDRPSIPKAIRHRTPRDRVEAILALRRIRMSGAEISALVRAS